MTDVSSCRFDDITTESYADSHPFNFARLNRSQSEYSEIGFDVSTVGSGGQTPRVVSPEDVGSQILKYLLSLTADVLGHTQVSQHKMNPFLAYPIDVLLIDVGE